MRKDLVLCAHLPAFAKKKKKKKKMNIVMQVTDTEIDSNRIPEQHLYLNFSSYVKYGPTHKPIEGMAFIESVQMLAFMCTVNVWQDPACLVFKIK